MELDKRVCHVRALLATERVAIDPDVQKPELLVDLFKARQQVRMEFDETVCHIKALLATEGRHRSGRAGARASSRPFQARQQVSMDLKCIRHERGSAGKEAHRSGFGRHECRPQLLEDLCGRGSRWDSRRADEIPIRQRACPTAGARCAGHQAMGSTSHV